MPNRLALIIANSRFDDPKLAHLTAPNKDAATLKRVLEDPDIGGFHVHMLVDAPYQHIRDEIVRLYERRKRSDLLLLYYSGHGITDDYGELYLATRDTKIERVSAASVEATFVRSRLNRSNSQRKVIILDCCHSGAFASGAKATVGSSVGTQEAFAGGGYGWGILTASNAFEFAWEDETQPVEARTSVFTQILVQGIESGMADLDQDGHISLQELYNYTREQLLTSGRTTQTPMMWVNQMEGQIIVARNPHPRAGQPSMLPPGLLEAIADSRAWMREGAVRELARLLHGPNEALGLAARQVLEKMTHDDSRSVSRVAAAALSADTPSTIAETPPTRHPSLKILLAPESGIVDVNTEVRWTVRLHNDGDDDLKRVILYFGDTQKGEPFDLLAGREKRFTLGRTYATSGDKRESVTATGIASDGRTVRHVCAARVTVRAPEPELHPSISLPDTFLETRLMV